jgi:uncharacterized membrane protein YdcZ (DUF606 family)
MERYKNVHLWVLIPFIIVMLGFLPSYWLKFTEAPWRQHLHGITATLWFVLLIVQPYLVTRGHIKQHRFYGMIALLLAGGVAISGLGAIPYNLVNDRLPDTAKYGLSFIDIILVPGFTIAVAMAVRSAKKIDDHARWMVSTIFWVVSPGLFRLLFVPLVIMKTPDIGSKTPLLLATAGIANILVLSYLMFRDRRMHPAYLFAATGSVVLFLPMTVGDMQWWRNLADSLFTI